MDYAKKQPIDALREGDRVEDVYVVKIKRSLSSYTKGFFFHLILTDASGKSIDYKYWGGSDEGAVKSLFDSIKPDSVVLVQGKAAMYSGKLQITTNEPDTIRVIGEGEYNPEDFIQPARADVAGMMQLLEARIGEVGNAELKSLLEYVLGDEKLKDKFMKHPGAIEIHHNWIGGLLQHTLEVLEYSMLAKRLHPDLDKDLLIAGSILHDIGKLDEMQVTARIKGTKRGQLQGHIALGYAHLSKAMDELGTSEDIRDKLLHIILSHHGREDYGSPKPPMTPEAFAVYYADEMSSKLSEITDYVRWAKDATEDEFMYHRRHGRNILLT